MSTFTIRVTTPAINSVDAGAPSFIDMVVTGSNDPLIPNGTYDAYCLNPIIDIGVLTDYLAQNYAGNTPASFVPIGFPSLTTAQVDELNWLLAQNFTSDPKYGGQYSYGEIQTAIWKIVGFTDAQIATVGLPLLTNNGVYTVDTLDINFLVSSAQAAVASGNGVVPTDSFFSTIIDPAGNIQPLIVQLQSAKLGDFVWLDSNANGIQDIGEAGVDNVVVELWSNGALVTSTVTGDDFSTAGVEQGYYQFAGLKAGSYQVKFIAPTGQFFTALDTNGNSQDAVDSDANPATGFSQVITLAAGESNQTIDAGLYKPASIGDKVWLDCNNNGIQDSGEAGVSGVKVYLLDSNGTQIASATTGAQGDYLFSNLMPGKYAIRVDKPVGYAFTTQDASVPGATDANDSDVNVTTGQSALVTLSSGQTDLTVDAGLIGAPVCVTYDFSGNSYTNGTDGNSRTYEMSGVSVTATAWSRDQGNGNWAEAYLGAYSGGLGVTDSSEGSGSYDRHTVDNVGGRDNYVVFQFSQDVIVDRAFLGYVVDDSDISVWIGSSATPITNVNDALLSSMSLYEENWTNNGNTRWADFNAGDVSGNVLIIAANTSDTTPEDKFKIEKLDVCTAVACDCETEPQKASIGDKVFLDCNNNGIQDDGEAGVAGVTVKLLSASGAVLGTTTTNASGEYLFNGLTPGDYGVQVVAPTGFGFAKQNQGTDDSKDSDVDTTTGKTVVTTLSPGENDTSWDAGLVPNPVCLTYDFSGNSYTNGTDGNSRTFTMSGVSVTATAWSREQGNGHWAEAYLGAYSGGLGVTDSSEGSGSYNRHTVDNVGGRDNYVVFQFSQDVVVDRTFLGYVVDDSDISVWIGSKATPITSVNDSLLSSMSLYEENWTNNGNTRWADINAGSVSGNVLIIAANTSDTTPEDKFKIEKLDVCTTPLCEHDVQKASIGDRVWLDSNANGIQDTGEGGLAGVTVELLGANGVIATTTTNGSGNYLFSGLNPGDYQVHVVAPSGYFVSPKDAGGDDARDSDIDPTTGSTVATNLTAGENDLSWDAGLFKKASVGDKVWDDMNHNNVQDSNEPGIGGIKVKLMDATGTTVLASTTTNSSGNYLFSNLNPGTYVLQFDKGNVQYYQYNQWNNMSNWKWAVQDTGSNDSVDSDVAGDARATTNVSKTMAFTLVSGQNDMTRDAGITPIVIDLDGNGIQTVSRANSGGSFDLFGNGSAVQSGWISGGEGFLAVDRNGNGQIDNISELFGGTAKGAGFSQLASYDSNGDGRVDAADSDFANLLIWRDANGNHQSDAGELMTLAEAGVAALNVDYSELPFLDRQGNLHFERSSATMADGRAVDMTDVYFNVAADDAAAAGVALPGLADLLHEDWSVGGDGSVVDMSAIYSSAAANDAVAAAEVPVSDPGWLFA